MLPCMSCFWPVRPALNGRGVFFRGVCFMRTNTHDYGHGGAYVRKREVRALAYVCSPMAFIVALLAVLLVPNIALADSSVIWGPSAIPNAENGIVVNAPDRYRAAAVALGYGDDAYSAWSDDVKAKLSNESTGGRFYQFAQLFGKFDDMLGNDNPITAVISAVGNSFWAIAETLYGDDIWIAGYSSQLIAGAASDLSSILSGDSVGGGGTGVDGDYWVFDFKANTGNLQNIKTVYVSKEYITFSGDLLGFDSVIMSGCIKFSSYNPSYNTIGGSAFNLCSDPSLTTEVTDGVYSLVQSHSGSYFSSLSGGSWSVDKIEDDSLYVHWASGDRNLTYKYDYGSKFVSMATNNVGVLISSGSEPIVPPTNWPDVPAAPSPPDLPEPGTDVPVEPTPWVPVISPTFDFDLNITTEPTSNDLIDWVKKIYFELRSFHSDEQDWFDEVGKGIDGLVDAINDAQEQIYDELQTIDETLRSEGQKIRDYMYQMFHWLKDQLNFQNDSFNDSNIVYWLKRIWGKLGDGDVNVRPVDPTVDPPAWWEWLNKMLDSLLDGLVGVFNELLGGTGDLLEEVIHQFPFSIPWDIAAFLTALAAAPVTPVFDIVIPAVDGWWSQITFHIDLSPYNTTAATVRLMTKLVFAGFLAWKSRELLDMMDVTKW